MPYSGHDPALLRPRAVTDGGAKLAAAVVDVKKHPGHTFVLPCYARSVVPFTVPMDTDTVGRM